MPTRSNRATTVLSSDHKRALAVGRQEGRVVRRYLEAVEAYRPKRGRKRTLESVKNRLAQVEEEIPLADTFTRVHLIQERIDLTAELRSRNAAAELAGLEAEFITTAKSFGERKGIGYAAWRSTGVRPSVLRQAGISPSSPSRGSTSAPGERGQSGR